VSDYPLTRPGLAVSASALEALVRHAAQQVDGVVVPDRPLRRRPEIAVEVREASVRAQLSLQVRYGVVLPEAAEAARRRVGETLGQMTGLPVDGVDVVVSAVA
jgi:uncharacterized alkaline shock family protein YloU